MNRVYLDHNATTPIEPRVLDAMRPWLECPANPSSAHAFGRAARDAVEAARAQVAALVGARADQVVFTSGGTESNNLALRGVTGAHRGAVVVSSIEHPAVREPALQLRDAGVELREVPVHADGRIDLDAFRAALPGAAVASAMWANNETGVIQDIAELAAACADAGVPLHTDAVQAAGKVPVDFVSSGVRLLSLSAHKLYGPPGIGALVFDRALTLVPPQVGGGQQGGVRGGTEPTALIVGFGRAAEIASAELSAVADRARVLRDRLEHALASLPGIAVVAGDAPRLPNTTLFTVAGIEGETLLLTLDQAAFAVSSGSACASGRREPSHVLRAMGVPADAGVVRVSTGRWTSETEIDGFTGTLKRLLGPEGGLTGGAVGGW